MSFVACVGRNRFNWMSKSLTLFSCGSFDPLGSLTFDSFPLLFLSSISRSFLSNPRQRRSPFRSLHEGSDLSQPSSHSPLLQQGIDSTPALLLLVLPPLTERRRRPPHHRRRLLQRNPKHRHPPLRDVHGRRLVWSEGHRST